MPPAAPEPLRGFAARRRLRRRILIALGVIAGLVSAASWFAAGPAEGMIRRLAERRIAAVLGGEASLGRLDVRLWRLEALFGDLRVTVPRESAAPIRVQVPEGRARLAWSGLFGMAGGHIRLRRLDVVGAVVEIEGRLGGAVRIDRRFTPGWAGHARYGLDRVRLSDVTDPIAVEEEKLENLRLGNVGVAMTRFTYDSLFAPTRGSLVDLSTALFARPLLSQATFVGLNGSAAGVHTFPRRVAGSPGRRGRGDPRGSLVSLRRDRRFHGVAFYDVGNVFATVSEMNLADLRHVFGAGIRFETPIGPFRVEYGKKLDREEGESSGELYLSIGNPF